MENSKKWLSLKLVVAIVCNTPIWAKRKPSCVANLHCESQELKSKGEANSSLLVLHPSTIKKLKIVLPTCLLPFLVTKGSRVFEKKANETQVSKTVFSHLKVIAQHCIVHPYCPQFLHHYATKSSAKQKSQQFTYKPFQSSWYFVLRTIMLRWIFAPEL